MLDAADTKLLVLEKSLQIQDLDMMNLQQQRVSFYFDPGEHFQKILGKSFLLTGGTQVLVGMQLWVHLLPHAQEEDD